MAHILDAIQYLTNAEQKCRSEDGVKCGDTERELEGGTDLIKLKLILNFSTGFLSL